MIICAVLMGDSEIHIIMVGGRTVLIFFFWATQMMMILPGLHYSRWLRKTVSIAVIHHLLYYYLVLIQIYISHLTAVYLLTHVHSITAQSNKTTFSGFSVITFFDTLRSLMPIVQVFGCNKSLLDFKCNGESFSASVFGFVSP